MSKEEILKECDKINDLLGIVDLEACVQYDRNWNPEGIGIIDLQGVCFRDPEFCDPMFSAKEVMDRCQMFFDDTYLDGEICCNCDHDFDTYAEAEEEARKTGYDDVADNIHELRKYYV